MSQEKITMEQLPELFESVAKEFADKKDALCEMDAKMGDGDLGLTMSKGYAALPDLIRQNTVEGDAGKTLAKAGMKMSSVVPSTMGTLMSSGIMSGGKAIAGAGEIGPEELAEFAEGFAAGIQKRGKCQPGDRTIYDAALPASQEGRKAADSGKDLAGVMQAILDGAVRGTEATRDMVPKYGKAAVFAAKAKGVEDQGAVAARCLFEGMAKYIV